MPITIDDAGRESSSLQQQTGGFLARLCAEARRHPALNHPWLTSISTGSLPDPVWALRDYAWHYHAYSSWFPHYLRAVIGRLDRADHRAALEHNLAEEQGRLGAEERAALLRLGIDPAAVDGVPHPVLFRRFCTAIGIDAAALSKAAPFALRWRTRFRRFLEQASPAAAVGALGIGTEGIVRPLYEQILSGIRRCSGLRRGDYVFFELHCEVDDHHQEDLLQIAWDLAGTERARRELRDGMLVALDLRREVWDFLYQRALSLHGVRYA